jgi:F-type H+-transporting ATPase subunit epsilon
VCFDHSSFVIQEFVIDSTMSDNSILPTALRCVVVTPETTIIDAIAEFVAVPLVDGECGIAPGHSPMIGRLGYGELRIRGVDEQQHRYFADGGFVQVNQNAVSILTNRAVPAASLDAATATEQLRTALARPAAGDEALAVRARLIAQARGQLHVARRGMLES